MIKGTYEKGEQSMELERITLFVEGKLGQDTTGHDLNHVRRVENVALKIAEQEKMALEEITIIRAAVLLHDVIDEKLFDDVEKAKQEVRSILQESGATAEEIDIIEDTIENMSYSKNLTKKRKLTKIGKVVQDADRIDAIGAIGIARTFYYGGSKGHAMYDETAPIQAEDLDEKSYRKSTNVVNHFYEKLLRLEDSMNTETGKKLAKSRTEFMKKYLEQLAREIRGEV